MSFLQTYPKTHKFSEECHQQNSFYKLSLFPIILLKRLFIIKLPNTSYYYSDKIKKKDGKTFSLSFNSLGSLTCTTVSNIGCVLPLLQNTFCLSLSKIRFNENISPILLIYRPPITQAKYINTKIHISPFPPSTRITKTF